MGVLACLRRGRLIAAGAVIGLVLTALAPRAAAAGRAGQAAVPGTITTIGGGVGGPGPATAVGVSPCAVTYAGGSLYITDSGDPIVFPGQPTVVRKINVRTGQLRTPAGNGVVSGPELGYPLASGVPATSTGIGDSCGVAVDHAGNILVSDSISFSDGAANSAPVGIRVVAASTGVFYGRHMIKGDIYTLLRSTSWAIVPGAIAVDRAGNVLFVSADNEVYALAEKRGTFYGIRMRPGKVYAIAGGGTKLSGGVPALQASLDFTDNSGHYYGQIIAGLRLDHHGNVVVADHGDLLVRVIAGQTGAFYGRRMRAGYIYTIAGNGRGYSGSGGVGTRTGIGEPAGIAVDHSGNIVIAGDRIFALAVRSGRFYGQVMTAGHVYRIAGSGRYAARDGEPALKAGFVGLSGVSVDGSGNVAVADSSGLWVIATRTGAFYGRPMRAGYTYRITGGGNGFSGDGGPATKAELLIGMVTGNVLPAAPLAIDGNGDVLFYNVGVIRIIAARTATMFGSPMLAGNIYTIAGSFQKVSGGDGGPATSAGLNMPDGIGTDSAGDLLIADTRNNRVRVVAAMTGSFYGRQMTAGDIYTVVGDGNYGETGDGGPATAAELASPQAVAADAAGNLVVTTGCEVRVVAAATGPYYGQQMTAGDIYTIAGSGTCQASGDGGPARSADLPHAGAVVIDPAGNVLVSEGSGAAISEFGTVRVIAATTGTFYGQQMTKGDIYSVAPGMSSIAVDGSGNLLLANPGFLGCGACGVGAVYVVAEHTGTFYGQQMTAGNTYTIAGNGQVGHGGDGGPGTQAPLVLPAGLAIDPTGDVVFTQFQWISEIAG